ncbi:spermidine resistance protein, partial [Ascosphaera atra]
TNVPQGQNGRETHDIIEHVVKIFKPGRFTATFFETKTHIDDEESDDELGFDTQAHRKRSKIRNAKMDRIPGYRRLDRIVHNLDGYDLVFRYYEREGFRGGGPRIGEAA